MTINIDLHFCLSSWRRYTEMLVTKNANIQKVLNHSDSDNSTNKGRQVAGRLCMRQEWVDDQKIKRSKGTLLPVAKYIGP